MTDEYRSLWAQFYTQWHDIVLMMVVSMVSGFVAHLGRLKRNRPHLFSLVEFAADILASGVAGFISLMVCLELKISPWYTGAIVGIIGHGAPRFLFLADRWLLNKAKVHLGVSDEQSQRN